MNKNFLDQEGLQDYTSGLRTKLDEKLNLKVTMVHTANPDHITVDNTDRMNPILGLNQNLIDKIERIYEEVFPEAPPELPKESTPSGTMDYVDEKLTGFIVNGNYVINGSAYQADSNGKISIDPSWLGNTIDIIKTSTDPNSFNDSLPQFLGVPTRPSAPSIQTHSNDGNVWDVNNTMEYRLHPSGNWTTVSEYSITGLLDGTYDVRYKAVANTSFASINAQVLVDTSVPISNGTISDTIIPATDIAAVQTIDNPQWSGTITGWSPSLMLGNIFDTEIAYTTNINIVPKSGYNLNGITGALFSVTNCAGANISYNNGTLTITFPTTAQRASSGPVWQITGSTPGTIAVISGTNGRIYMSNWNGYNPSMLAQLNDDVIYPEGENAYTSMDDYTVRLYAKFVTDADFVEAWCDNLGNGTVGTNKIQRWGFVPGANPYVQLLGSNSTGNPVQYILAYDPTKARLYPPRY